MNKFFLNLGVQPLANNFLKKYSAKQPTYNLKLYFNTKIKDGIYFKENSLICNV